MLRIKSLKIIFKRLFLHITTFIHYYILEYFFTVSNFQPDLTAVHLNNCWKLVHTFNDFFLYFILSPLRYFRILWYFGEYKLFLRRLLWAWFTWNAARITFITSSFSFYLRWWWFFNRILLLLRIWIIAITIIKIFFFLVTFFLWYLFPLIFNLFLLFFLRFLQFFILGYWF